MTEQDRLRILYDLTLRDIDHAKRRIVHVVRYFVPIPVLVVVLAVLIAVLELAPTQAVALLLATVPASVFAYVGWSNSHDDRVEKLTLDAADLRLRISCDKPIAVERSGAARSVEQNIAAAKGRLGGGVLQPERPAGPSGGVPPTGRYSGR